MQVPSLGGACFSLPCFDFFAASDSDVRLRTWVPGRAPASMNGLRYENPVDVQKDLGRAWGVETQCAQR